MVDFKEERKGYSKEQVKVYVKMLNDEYQKLTEEYQNLAEEHQELTQEHQNLAAEYQELTQEHQNLADESQKLTQENESLLETNSEPDTSYTEAIASTLIKAEIAGKQILSDAQAQAKGLIYDAEQEISRINRTKKVALEEIRSLSNELQSYLATHGRF